MKKFNYVLCMLLSLSTALTSCLSNSDSEVTLYDDAVITSFVLGTMTQYKEGTSEVVATITGSNYPMTIDQLGGKIYNRTPLPVGTKVNSVVCTVSSLNNGAIALKNTTDDDFSWFNSELGIDFESHNTHTFRVYASDGSFHRDYSVTLNVATSTGTNLDWGEAVADTTLLRGFTDMRMVTLKNKRLVALCSDGAYTHVRFSDDFGTTWSQPETLELLADSAWASAVVKDSTLFLLSDGRLCSSDDGEHWNSITADATLKRLVAAGTRQLFALTSDSTLKSSADNGVSWAEEQVDESLPADSVKRLLALDDISSTAFNYPASYHADYVLMAGHRGAATVVWQKVSHYDPAKSSDRWMNIASESINKYQLPATQHLALLYYDDSILAFGDDTNVYQSTDQGITWRTASLYALPEEMLAAAVDGEGRLCAIAKSGKVYRARRY